MPQANTVSVRLSIEGAETMRASLIALGKDGEAALARLNFDTATGGGKAFNAIMEEGSSLARGYASTLGPIGNVLSSLEGGWLAAGAAAGGFLLVLEQSIAKAEAHEQAMRGVEAVLRATGDASGVTANQIDGMAGRISSSTLQSRDSVLSAAEALATFGVVGPDSFEKTLRAGADLATSPLFNGDLAGAVKAISLAAEGSFNSLQHAGVKLTDQQKQMITTFDETGRAADAVGIVIQAVEDKMGGLGASQDQGLAGATHHASEAWDQLLTDLGKSDSAGGVAEAFLDGLADRLDRIDRLGKSHGFLAVAGMIAGSAFGLPTIGQIDKWENGDNPNASLDSALAGPLADVKVTSGPSASELSAYQQRWFGEVGDALNRQIFGEGDAKVAELKKSPLQQAIDTQVAQWAKEAGTTPGMFATDPHFAGQYQHAVSDATSIYNEQNAGKWAAEEEAAQRRAQEAWARSQAQLKAEAAAYASLMIARDHDLMDFDKYLDGIEADEAKSHSERVKAQDELTLDLLKGHSGYFAAAHDAQQHESEAALQIIDADTNKQLAALDERYAEFTSKYGLDATAAAEYAQARATVMMSWSEKTTAQLATDQQKQLELTRQAEGDLAKWIDMADADGTQTLKTLASDGLGSIDNALKAVASGTEKVGDAAKSVLLDITGDAFQKAVEGNVLGPLGKWLNGEIGDGAKADGSEDNPFYVKLAGLGVGGGSGGLLGDFFDSIGLGNLFGGNATLGLDNTPLSTVFNPADLVTPQLPHFAGGGEFDVPGAGGTDSRLVAFKATPGETVSIRTPSQRNYVDPMKGGGSPALSAPVVNNTNHFHMTGAVSEQAVKGMIQQGMGQAVQTVKSNLMSWWQDQWARFQN